MVNSAAFERFSILCFRITYTMISTGLYAIYGLIGVFTISVNEVTTLAFFPLLICIGLLVVNKLVRDWLSD